MAAGLVPDEVAHTCDVRCTCYLYRRKVFRAFFRIQPRRLMRFLYFGAVRFFELDERRDRWDVVDARKQGKKPLKNLAPQSGHRLLCRLGKVPRHWLLEG